MRDDHLHPHAGNELHAELGPGERLRHPDPAGALLILLAIAVPVELHLDAAVLVGVDLLTGGPHDQGRLHGARRPRRIPGRPPHRVTRHRLERVLVFEGLRRLGRRLVGSTDAGPMDHLGEQVFLAAFCGIGVRLDLERVARREAAARARARGDAGRRLLRLDPHLRRGVAVGLLLIKAGVVEKLRLAGARVSRLAIARGQQARRRFLEGVVGLDELPRPERIFMPPIRDHAGRGRRRKPLRCLDLGLLAVGEGGVGVGDHHLQRPLRVLEVVADALMFHEPAHEGEVGLPILHAIVPGGVAARDLLRERDRGRVAEHRLDDVGHRLLLKNLAVARERGKPQARHHLDLPPGEQVVAAHPGKAADIAREPAGRIARVVDPEAHLLADDRRVA